MAWIGIALASLVGTVSCAHATSSSPPIARDQLVAELQGAGLDPPAATCVADALADLTLTRADLDAIYVGAATVDVAKAQRFNQAVATCVPPAPAPAPGS